MAGHRLGSQPLRFALLLSAIILAAFPDVVFGLKTFFYRDYAIFGYPLAFYHKEQFWNGEIPLWNPYNNSGLPFLAQWNTLVLYPLSLIYLLFPLPWSLSIFCLFHLFGGGMGAYFLTRSWSGSSFGAAVAGIAFAFSGLALSCLKWPNNIAALGCFPWVFWLSERGWKHGGRSLLLAALLAATQMLSGAPEIILFTWILLAALMLLQWLRAPKLLWRYPARFSVLVLIVTALAAAQLLPFLELLAHSQRGAAYSDASWAMPPSGWLNLLVPLFHCFPSHEGVYAQIGQYWISSYYPGIGIVLLAGIAFWDHRRPKVVFLSLFALLGGLLAMGSTGGIYTALRHSLPLLGFVRFPIKFIAWTAMLLPLAAGYAFASRVSPQSHLKSADESPLPLWIWTGTLGLLIIAAIALGLAYPLALPGWPAAAELRALLFSAGRSAVFLAGFCALIVAGRKRGWNTSLQLLALAWLAADLLTQAPQLNPRVDPWVLQPSSPQTPIVNLTNNPPQLGQGRALITAQAESRLDHLAFTNPIEDVLYSRKALFANCNLIDGIPKIDGFYSLYIKEENNLRAVIDAPNHPAAPALLQFLSVSQMTAPGKMIDWSPRSPVLPLLTSGQQPVYATNAAAVLRGLLASLFDPKSTVYIQAPSLSSAELAELPRSAVAARISNIVVRPQSISASTDAPQPFLLVISQTDYPGWKGLVDRHPVPIVRANYAFQALSIPSGRHQVQLKFQSNSFRLGALISLATLLLVIIALFRIRLPFPLPPPLGLLS